MNPRHNRLAYDASWPQAQRKTETLSAPAANDPLQPAGLFGPVRLRVGKVVRLPL